MVIVSGSTIFDIPFGSGPLGDGDSPGLCFHVFVFRCHSDGGGAGGSVGIGSKADLYVGRSGAAACAEGEVGAGRHCRPRHFGGSIDAECGLC